MTDKHFIDWENDVFGYGYGTGEIYTVPLLARFMRSIPESGTYNFQDLERAFGEGVTWLMINILCHADIIEYGTSPRFAWLSAKGKILRNYLESKGEDELMALMDREDNDYCLRDHCNCEVPCSNPLF